MLTGRERKGRIGMGRVREGKRSRGKPGRGWSAYTVSSMFPAYHLLTP